MSRVEWERDAMNSQPRNRVSLWRERKRKRKKHLGEGVLTTLTSQILAEGGQAASQLGGLRRDEKPRQSYEGWVH